MSILKVSNLYKYLTKYVVIHSSLDADTLCCACGYKDANGIQRKLTWAKTELKYDPSYNMCPRDVLPCITSGSHFEGEKEERVLCAMTWGMIPSWYQASYNIRFIYHKYDISPLQICYLTFKYD